MLHVQFMNMKTRETLSRCILNVLPNEYDIVSFENLIDAKFWRVITTSHVIESNGENDVANHIVLILVTDEDNYLEIRYGRIKK